MRVFLVVALLSCFVVEVTKAQQKVTTLILVRHAEKDNDGTKDPDLSEAGKARAQALVATLQETQVDGIYSTNYKRTRNTVAPLATAKSKAVQFYEPFKDTEIDRIIKAHEGKTVVISGHSNSIPWIANLVTNTKEYADWKESDYDNLLIVSVVERGKVASVTWLNYGIPTN